MPLADELIVKDEKRLKKLYSLHLLDISNDPAFDRLTHLASKVLHAPISLVTLIDANRQYLLSQIGMDEPTARARETPLLRSFCQHLVALGQPLIVSDTREHPLLFDNPAAQDNLIAYAGMPLITSDGFTLGSFCVIDKKPREWTPDEIEILKELSLSVLTEIELHTELEQRQQVEAALKKSEQFNQRIISTLPSRLYIFDLERKEIIFANQSAHTLPTQGVNFSEFTRFIHPDDVATFEGMFRQAEALKDDEHFEAEFRRRGEDGEWSWLYIHASIFNRSPEGKPQQIIGIAQDITARKKTEEALRDNQHLLQSILDSTPDSIYIHDVIGDVNLFTSREITQQLGYTPEQIREMGAGALETVIHPDDLPKLYAHYAKMAQSKDGEVLGIEYRSKLATGGLHWFSSHDSVFKRKPDGTVWQIIGVARDITDRKQMEEAIHANEVRLRAVLSKVPLVLFSTDNQGRFTLSMGKGLEALGKQDNESVGTSIFEVYQNNPEILNYVQHALTGETVTGLVSIGSVTYEIWYTPLFDEIDHHVTGMMGIAIDITERVRTEQALQETLENLMTLREVESELSHSLNLESVLLVANDTIRRLTLASDGYIALISLDDIEIVQPLGLYERGQKFNKNTGVVGRVLRSQIAELLVDVSLDPDYVANIAETKSQMAVPLTYRDRMIGIINLETPDPAAFTKEAFEFMKLIVGQITLAIDNAQLYEVSQQQLLDMTHLYGRVSELEQLKTDIIRIAAHDLRNPLTQVLGYSDLLLEEPGNLDPDSLEFIEAIQKAGTKMERIIKDILSLERIEASSNERQETIDLTNLVSTLFFENQSRAEQRNQIYKLEVPEITIQVHADGAQLREAIDNLIGNAIKYTPDNRSISVKLRTEPEGKVMFEVVDSGIGIPEPQQARLFQPFYRVKTEETAQIEGTGLGLHLVKNIIERHQGKMVFKSVYGEGSTFGFEMKTV